MITTPTGRRRATYATGLSDAAVEHSLSFVDGAFSREWLHHSPFHRVQRLWHRDDVLATLELVTLGDAIERMQQISRSWVKKTVRTIKQKADSCHGYLFELVCGAMLASSMEVRAMPNNTPGYDFELQFADGHVSRVSLKNHDMSMHERTFREHCERLHTIARHRLRQLAPSAVVIITSERCLHGADFESLEAALLRIDTVSREPRQLNVGIAQLAWRILDAPQPGAFDRRHFSDTFVVFCGQHPNEQKKFVNKIKEAGDGFKKAPCRQADINHVLMMRVHQTADVAALQQSAQVLVTGHEQMDSVFLYQPSIVRNQESTTISNCYVAAVNLERLGQHRPLKIVPRFGTVTTEPSSLLMAGLPISPRSYVYQRGDHFVLAAPGANEQQEGHVQNPACGIRIHSVFDVGGSPLILQGKFPEYDELEIL